MQLGLKTFAYLQPYPYLLGWLQKDVEMQVTCQCKFKSTFQVRSLISWSDALPSDVCEIVLHGPYFRYKDVILLRENKWRLEKKVKLHLINRYKGKKTINFMLSTQAKRLNNIGVKFAMLVVRPRRDNLACSELEEVDIIVTQREDFSRI